MHVEILITSRNRVIREKATVPRSIKKLPKLCGTESFTTVLIRAHHLSVYGAKLIQSVLSHPILLR